MAKTLAANYESGVKGARAGKRLAPLRTVPGSQDPENGPESVIKETQRPDDGRHDVGGSKPINFQVRLPWSRRCASCQCPARPKSARHIRRPPSPAPSAASAALSPLHHRRAASPWCVAPRSGFPPNSPARCEGAHRPGDAFEALRPEVLKLEQTAKQLSGAALSVLRSTRRVDRRSSRLVVLRRSMKSHMNGGVTEGCRHGDAGRFAKQGR